MPCPLMEAGKRCSDCEETSSKPLGELTCDKRVSDYQADLINGEYEESRGT